MKRIILVRYGEIILKGLNRPVFEDRLVKNIRNSLYGLGRIEVTRSQARIYIDPLEESYDFDAAVGRLKRVFGIVSVSIVRRVKTAFDEIKSCALDLAKENALGKAGPVTFKVETKRGDKGFPLKSPEISSEVGAYILDNLPFLKVDVNNPTFVIFIEVREDSYLYSEIIPAYGGMPIGTNGKALLLLSGGIDSPVAGWMVAKRGVEVEAVHFYSYPYTSERSKEKVLELARILSCYCGHVDLHIVPFTKLQEAINENCPLDQLTIIMRRAMMRISERIAAKTGSLALVTGESIGQVASQTLQSLSVTNAVVGIPVFRPLIGMDKNEVVSIARKIGTFETSILPYEDCCTVFVAKHPNTKPHMGKIALSESRLELEALINQAVENTELVRVTPGDKNRTSV